MGYFKYKGSKVFYEVLENPSASQTVALLHGNAASSKMFAPVMSLYRKRYSVLLVDFLNYGQSDRAESLPDNLWFYESEQLVALIESLFDTPICAVGTSGGALVALNAVLARPHLFSRVVADSFMGFQSTDVFIAYLKKERAEAKKSLINRMFFRYQHGKDWDAVIKRDTEAILKQASTGAPYVKGDLSQSKTPILFTASREDPFIKTGSVLHDIEELAKSNPAFSYHFFTTGGHPAMLSKAREFSALVDSFFETDDRKTND